MMLLINNTTLSLELFMGTLPEYAILSHTWEDGEVTLEDFTHEDKTVRSRKKGFAKIQKTCQLATALGLKYSWVDTCCIDKKSSAELTEAINSMFKWYQGATVCFAWLADLSAEKKPQLGMIAGLGECRWFTRGWTLQELIAPSRVEFYDAKWTFRGTKQDLAGQLTSITNISGEALRDPSILPRLSIAQRMAWAAGRQTTRIEDMAYCLLGIFGVNMPMMYGEGERAFIRLQENIAAQSNDFSLFAWRDDAETQTYRGVFANSPREFRHATSVQVIGSAAYNPEFLITNKGLRLTPSLFPGPDGAYFLGLNCIDSSQSGAGQKDDELGIWIRPHGAGVYSRVKSSEYAFRPPSDQAPKVIRVFISRTLTPEASQQFEKSSTDHAFVLRRGFNEMNTPLHHPAFPFEAIQILPNEQWDSQQRMFVTQGAGDFSAYAYFMPRYESEMFKNQELFSSENFILAFGRTLSEGGESWVCVGSLTQDATLQPAIGDARKMAVVIRKSRDRRMLLLMDGEMKISKALHVSLETLRQGSQVTYYIDMEVREAPPGFKGRDEFLEY